MQDKSRKKSIRWPQGDDLSPLSNKPSEEFNAEDVNTPTTSLQEDMQKNKQHDRTEEASISSTQQSLMDEPAIKGSVKKVIKKASPKKASKTLVKKASKKSVTKKAISKKKRVRQRDGQNRVLANQGHGQKASHASSV